MAERCSEIDGFGGPKAERKIVEPTVALVVVAPMVALADVRAKIVADPAATETGKIESVSVWHDDFEC